MYVPHCFTFLMRVYLSNVLQVSTVIGRNVYGILRAGRSLGTESIILSVPLLEEGGHNRHGIAVMLALAEYFQSKILLCIIFETSYLQKLCA